MTSRNEFITAQSSEKIVLAHVHATVRLILWTVESGSIYKKTTDHFVTALKQGTTVLTQVATLGAVVEGTWYYDIETSALYTHINGSTDPTSTAEMIVTFRFFYSNTPMVASWDLENLTDHVHYDPRIIRSPGYKHKVGVEQKLTSLVGSGTLRLENNDGALDSVFDTLYFENQVVEVYSWNRHIDFEDAQIIYRGRVQNKNYNTKAVWFNVKDQIHDLLQNVPQTAYSDSDNVNSDIKGRYKRWIYGRVDGLKLQSLDQIGDGYAVSGTFAGNATTTTLTVAGGQLFNELSPDDTLTIGTQEFTIISVDSPTAITVGDEPTFAFSGQSATVVPFVPPTSKNREFLVAGHACTELKKTVIQVPQFNRVELSDVEGLSVGDFIEFTTGERIQVKAFNNNVVTLQKNLVLIPAVASSVIRQPVQRVFVEGVSVSSDNFVITNNSSECKITLSTSVEFDLTKTTTFGFDGTFTNGSVNITTADDIDLREILSTRDWIKPSNVLYTTFFQILSVEEKSVKLRTPFTGVTITEAAEGRKPSYIGDSSSVSADTLGRTEDGLTTGTWIETGAKAAKDLLTQIGAINIDSSTFDTAAEQQRATLSLTIPSSVSGSTETVKSVVDKINKTTRSSLTLGLNLKLQYRVMAPQLVETDLIEISDKDVIDWSIKTTNGKLYGNALLRYRHVDIARNTLAAGSSALTFESPFVQNYIGTNQGVESDMYLYDQEAAEVAIHRELFYNSLGRADITLETDLRLEGLEIGDPVTINFDRLYKRLGDKASRKKVCVVIGLTVTGEKIKIELTDLGNIYNRASIITPNAAPDWSAASEDEKLKYGYITDANGIIDDDEDTGNIHLIS